MDVYYSPWHWIFVAVILVFALRVHFGVGLFVDNYIAQFDFVFSLAFYFFESFLDLGRFDSGYRFHLARADPITVEDNTIWIGTIHLFELGQRFCHEHFQLEANFLSNFGLHYGF